MYVRKSTLLLLFIGSLTMSVKQQYEPARTAYQFIGEHEDDGDVLLPDHLPEVGAGVLQRALGHNVLVCVCCHCELEAEGGREKGGW